MASARDRALLARLTCMAALLLSSGASMALDLEEAFRLATVNDADYLAARAKNEAAQEAVPQARAGLLPVVSASVGQSQNDMQQTAISYLTGKPVTQTQNYRVDSKVLSLRQPLVRFGNWANYLQAKAQVQSADATLEQDTQDLAVKLAGAYFEAVFAYEQLASVQAQKDAYAAQVKAAERGFKAGYNTRTDIDDARAKLGMTIAQEISIRQNLVVAQRSLAVMINRPVADGSLARIDGERLGLDTPTPDNLEAWLERAEENNPTLRALRANIEVAQREVTKNRSAHLPTLDLVANRSYSSNESVNTIGVSYWTTSVGLQLNLPIFSGGQINSATREAVARLEQTRQQYEAGRHQVEVEISREFGAVTQGVAQVHALEQALTAAEQDLISTRKGVQAGTRNTLDVLNAVQQVAAAKVDLAKGRIQYIIARLKLKAAAGELGPEDITTTNRWLVQGS